VLASLGFSEAVRSTVHRVAAVVLIILAIYHTSYILFTRRGREALRLFLPDKRDITNLWNNFLYYLGKRKKLPSFDHYDYTEKLEYWALVWGIVIMAVTGLILWFPEYLPEKSPLWLIKVSEVVHYYEAWLATLAIIIWHFFFTIFHPHEYPISFVWLTGKMDIHDYMEKHRGKFDKILHEINQYNSREIQFRELSTIAQHFFSSGNYQNFIKSESGRKYKQ
jgi:succinate dehydrogenase hydrophobic anchor subunit